MSNKRELAWEAKRRAALGLSSLPAIAPLAPSHQQFDTLPPSPRGPTEQPRASIPDERPQPQQNSPSHHNGYDAAAQLRASIPDERLQPLQKSPSYHNGYDAAAQLRVSIPNERLKPQQNSNSAPSHHNGYVYNGQESQLRRPNDAMPSQSGIVEGAVPPAAMEGGRAVSAVAARRSKYAEELRIQMEQQMEAKRQARVAALDPRHLPPSRQARRRTLVEEALVLQSQSRVVGANDWMASSEPEMRISASEAHGSFNRPAAPQSNKNSFHVRDARTASDQMPTQSSHLAADPRYAAQLNGAARGVYAADFDGRARDHSPPQHTANGGGAAAHNPTAAVYAQYSPLEQPRNDATALSSGALPSPYLSYATAGGRDRRAPPPPAAARQLAYAAELEAQIADAAARKRADKLSHAAEDARQDASTSAYAETLAARRAVGGGGDPPAARTVAAGAPMFPAAAAMTAPPFVTNEEGRSGRRHAAAADNNYNYNYSAAGNAALARGRAVAADAGYSDRGYASASAPRTDDGYADIHTGYAATPSRRARELDALPLIQRRVPLLSSEYDARDASYANALPTTTVREHERGRGVAETREGRYSHYNVDSAVDGNDSEGYSSRTLHPQQQQQGLGDRRLHSPAADAWPAPDDRGESANAPLDFLQNPRGGRRKSVSHRNLRGDLLAGPSPDQLARAAEQRLETAAALEAQMREREVQRRAAAARQAEEDAADLRRERAARVRDNHSSSSSSSGINNNSSDERRLPTSMRAGRTSRDESSAMRVSGEQDTLHAVDRRRDAHAPAAREFEYGSDKALNGVQGRDLRRGGDDSYNSYNSNNDRGIPSRSLLPPRHENNDDDSRVTGNRRGSGDGGGVSTGAREGGTTRDTNDNRISNNGLGAAADATISTGTDGDDARLRRLQRLRTMKFDPRARDGAGRGFDDHSNSAAGRGFDDPNNNSAGDGEVGTNFDPRSRAAEADDSRTRRDRGRPNDGRADDEQYSRQRDQPAALPPLAHHTLDKERGAAGDKTDVRQNGGDAPENNAFVRSPWQHYHSEMETRNDVPQQDNANRPSGNIFASPSQQQQQQQRIPHTSAGVTPAHDYRTGDIDRPSNSTSSSADQPRYNSYQTSSSADVAPAPLQRRVANSDMPLSLEDATSMIPSTSDPLGLARVVAQQSRDIDALRNALQVSANTALPPTRSSPIDSIDSLLRAESDHQQYGSTGLPMNYYYSLFNPAPSSLDGRQRPQQYSQQQSEISGHEKHHVSSSSRDAIEYSQSELKPLTSGADAFYDPAAYGHAGPLQDGRLLLTTRPIQRRERALETSEPGDLKSTIQLLSSIDDILGGVHPHG